MTASIEVHIDYYAVFKEQRGLASETLCTSASTLHELYAELACAYGFSLPAERVRVAVDDEFCNWERALKPGDRVVFIAPVAGG